MGKEMTGLNYIREINAFYDWLETNTLSDSAINLWHALMHINNKTGWLEEFSVALSTLQLKTGLKKDAVILARKRLQEAGRITSKSRSGQQSAMYSIVPFTKGYKDCVVLTDTNCDTNPVTNPAQTATQTPTLTPSITKLNETKINETNILPPEEKEERIPYQEIKNLFHELCPSYSKIRTLSGERKKHTGARYRQYGNDLSIFEELFHKAEDSDFLKGKNDRNWKADFDWMMNETNMAKILEDKYANKDTRTAAQIARDKMI